MLEQNPGGIILSTDEYFNRNGVYHYEPDLLGEAHSWNHQRGEHYRVYRALQKKNDVFVIVL